MFARMSTKTICDGCGNEIKPWNPQDPNESDRFHRELRLRTGTHVVAWDLCNPCQGRVADAIAEALPHTPRAAWIDAVRSPQVSDLTPPQLDAKQWRA